MPKAGPTLRSKLDGTWYLEAHPESGDFFKEAVGVSPIVRSYRVFTNRYQRSLLYHMMVGRPLLAKKSSLLMKH
jgi:hypothetical protein